jgi:hypothetical protein
MNAKERAGTKAVMGKSEILEILNDWNFWKNGIDTGIKRAGLLEEVKRLSAMKEIIVVTGIRRSGKSTILQQFCKSLMEAGTESRNILIVNFEDPRFRGMDLKLLDEIYETYLTELAPDSPHCVILDEVQKISGWEKFARFLSENKKACVFVMGSSSKLLSSEYSTTLAGRHVDIEIFPLSFREFLSFRGIGTAGSLDIAAGRHAIKRCISEYFRFGGFPKIAIIEDERGKSDLLAAYFRDIVIKDVVERYRINEIEKLEEMAKYYLTNISCVQSLNKVKNIIGLSLDTTERFSRYLENVYLISFVKKFSYKKKEQLLNPKKVYCIDTGMRNVVSFRTDEERGRLAENVVFTELKRRGTEIFYWRDEKQREVDFVIKSGGKITRLIQVCWDISAPETRKRETDALLSGMDRFGLEEGLIITENEEGEEKTGGKRIKYVPIWKWLLTRD